MTTVVLTRRLGLEGYGLFALTATLIVWIEWTLTSVFARATVKLIRHRRLPVRREDGKNSKCSFASMFSNN